MSTWTNHVKEEEDLMQRALAPEIETEEIDDKAPPSDGNAYLARVQKEAKKYSDTLVAGNCHFRYY